MPSPKHTKIDLLPEAYLALESESILKGKTLKKLASELIMKGVSKESLDFAKKAMEGGKTNEFDEEKMARVIREIGTPATKFNKTLLAKIREIVLKDGFYAAMLYVSQNTASLERDELHRVLTICSYYKIPPSLAANVFGRLNES